MIKRKIGAATPSPRETTLTMFPTVILSLLVLFVSFDSANETASGG